MLTVVREPEHLPFEIEKKAPGDISFASVLNFGDRHQFRRTATRPHGYDERTYSIVPTCDSSPAPCSYLW